MDARYLKTANGFSDLVRGYGELFINLFKVMVFWYCLSQRSQTISRQIVIHQAMLFTIHNQNIMNTRLFFSHYSLPKNNGSSCQTRLSLRQGIEFNCIYIYIMVPAGIFVISVVRNPQSFKEHLS